VLAWFAAGKVLAPARNLALTARTISESDLTRRIAVEGSGEMAELAKTFNAMMDRIQSAFTIQRNFINDAGHELRTPITIIQGHLDLIGAVSEDQQETIDLVSDELNRMNRIVDDLVLLAKAEQPNFLHLETIDLKSFMAELHTKATALATRNWQLKVKGNRVIVGDRQRITGALLNLLNNAAQHTKEDALIELGVAVDKKEVQFWVRDTGVGIALEEQERIFSRFARGESSRRRPEGVGLGSQLNVGSTFTLVMPCDI
jgi:signal transduction histidine kinase